VQPSDPVFLAQGPFARLRDAQKLLARRSIAAEIVQPPGANANA